MVEAFTCYKKSLRGIVAGLAVYEPDNDDLNAGHCGYFDSLGQWTTIRDLNSIEKTDTHYKPLSRRVPVSDHGGRRTEWGPVLGRGVQTAKGTLEANAQVPGYDCKGTMTFTSTKENAAILMVDPVIYYRCEDDQTLKDWLNENEELLMQDLNHRNNVIAHGLCIITGVYKTPRCTIGQWRGQGTKITIELDIGVFNQSGQVTGGGSWERIAGGGHWKKYGFDTTRPENLSVVVQGIRYSPNWFIKLLQQLYDKLRPMYCGSSAYMITKDDDMNENVHALGSDSDQGGKDLNDEDLKDISELQ